MDKRFDRKTGKLVAAAVAGLGLASFAAQQADAALVVDLRALSATNGTVIDAGNVQLTGVAPATVTFAVFAKVNGANSVLLQRDWDDDDFDGNSLTGTPDVQHPDDMLQIVSGSVLSSNGGLLGNVVAGAGFGPAAPFTASGAASGTSQDIDGDGDNDLGSAGATSTGKFTVRSGSPTVAATVIAGGAPVPLGTSNADPEPARTRLASGEGPGTPEDSEFRIGTLRFIVSAAQIGTGSNTTLSFVPRPDPIAGAATWFEDDVAKAAGPGFLAGAGINVSVIPEPASLGLLGMAGLGLLARRRK
jgi:hypothetical protein